MYGFTYRNIHSGSFGLIIKTKTRPVAPPVKNSIEEVTAIDGTVDYSDCMGRLYYNDKILEVGFTYPGKDMNDLHKQISKVVQWLSGGYGELIFDDMPNVRWIARPIDLQALTVKHIRCGTSTVQFRCEPFNELIYDSTGIPIGSDIPIGSNTDIGFGEDSLHNLASGTNNITYNYIGNANVMPVLHFIGHFEGISVECNGRTFEYSDSIEELYIGGKNHICTSNDGADVSENSNGEYIEFKPADNEIIVKCTGGGTMEIIHNAKYYYGDVNFDD